MLFSQAEARIALLRRCQPENGPAALARWLEAFRRGEEAGFAWLHARPPRLDPLKRALDAALRSLRGHEPLEQLYGERAEELRLEAELAEQVGQASFFALARRRYPVGETSEWSAARDLAEAWARQAPEPELGPLYMSHDHAARDSLVSVLIRELAARQLPLRVLVVASLASRAATAEGAILVRSGVSLGVRAARRIAEHEIQGHAAPRVRARAQQVGLCRAGSARASDDEEGRALAIEQRLELMDLNRRIELGRRHLAALAVADGASATDCVRRLVACGAAPAEASATYARVARGGGLCRELAYLPAWLRVQAAGSRAAELMRWLEHGRLSLDAAGTLLELGLSPVTTSLRDGSVGK